MRDAPVQEWMTRFVITVDPKTSVPDAQYLMSSHRIRRLPVVTDGALVGIVTRSDLMRAPPSSAALGMWDLPYALAKTDVQQVMTLHPATIQPEATLAEAARLMLERKIGGVPVVDSTGALAGILTESDIFRAVAGNWHS